MKIEIEKLKGACEMAEGAAWAAGVAWAAKVAAAERDRRRRRRGR